YTVIGDAVNIASRLQMINKIYHTKILISDEVYSKIGNQFVVRPLDIVEVKGKKNKIKIYELMASLEGVEEIQAKPEDLELSAEFTKGYNAFYAGDINTAKALFQAIA